MLFHSCFRGAYARLQSAGMVDVVFDYIAAENCPWPPAAHRSVLHHNDPAKLPLGAALVVPLDHGFASILDGQQEGVLRPFGNGDSPFRDFLTCRPHCLECLCSCRAAVCPCAGLEVLAHPALLHDLSCDHARVGDGVGAYLS